MAGGVPAKKIIIVVGCVGVFLLGAFAWYVYDRAPHLIGGNPFGEQGFEGTSGDFERQFGFSAGSFRFDRAQEYASEVFAATYAPSEELFIERVIPSTDRNMVEYQSQRWNADGREVFVSAFQSLKGAQYDESDLWLDVDAVVVREADGDEQFERLFQELSTYFIPAPIQFQFSEVRFRTIPDMGETIEVSWQAEDSVKETRGVWKNPGGDQPRSIYFFACKVYPDSPLYEEGTCFDIRDE